MKKGKRGKGKKLHRRLAVCARLCGFILVAAACGTKPPENKVKRVTAPVSILPGEAIKIEKPVNVSFSTYSKEWPVGWQWIDPDEKSNPARYDVKKGVLRVRVPTKKDLYGDSRNAPRYIKAISGDFQIETRVRFAPKENSQGAGLLIYKDSDNYISFERAYGGVDGGGEGLRMDARKGATNIPILTTRDIQTEAPEVDLKIVRSGRVFIGYWRLNDESEWREAGEFESDFPETIFAGVVASNTARETVAEFSYIRLLPAVRR